MTYQPRRPSIFARLPWWLLAIGLLFVLGLWAITTDDTYAAIFRTLSGGVVTTLWVTILAFVAATILGLLIALARTSGNRVLREIATFYVEIIRGIPILVFLFYVAFVAAPAADAMGNVSGRLGRAACGTLGYPMVDVGVARHVVAVTDTLLPYPLVPRDIPQDKVDHVVEVPSIGDPQGIASGTTQPATDAASLEIAGNAAAAIRASGLLQDGFAFQTGAGGISLATAQAVGHEMQARGTTGSFACGGITGFHVKLLEAGLFRALMDVQCFDLEAAASYARNPAHQGMSAAAYAGPHVGGAVVDRLSAVVLGAAEVDLDFNVNVTTRANGMIAGGSGGHADAAQGARLTIVTTRLIAAGYAKIVPRVTTLTTPGATVDVIATEAGLAVNPARPELAERLRHAGLTVLSIEDLHAKAAAAATKAPPEKSRGPVVAVSEYRDGSVTDVIRRIEEG